MNSNPNRQVIYHDNSLSAFITGIVFGGVAALMLGTDEGRTLTKKLKKNLSRLTKDIQPHLEDLPEKTQHFVETVRTQAQNLTPLPPELRQSPPDPDVAGRLHRADNSSTTFTQGGKPL